MATDNSSVASRTSEGPAVKLNFFDRITTGEGGIDFIGRTKLWYWITAVWLIISVAAIAIRGFDLSIDFEGGTKMNMPAADLVVEEVEETFIDATGVIPELTQIVGTGSTATLEINSERLSEDQIEDARLALFDEYAPVDAAGRATPDAIGDSTVSESWGSTITNRMIVAMVVFLILAFVYIAVRLQREMAAAAMLALVIDGIVIAGIYALFGLEVSPAAIIGLLTVLAFSIYDTVIVFDKVRENTEGITQSRTQTYGEAANAAVNQTVMRSISTSVISGLPIVALMVVAVWMLGVGALQDLALIQLIGVVEGMFSSIFLATPLLVSIANRREDIKKHNDEVRAFRMGDTTSAGDDVAAPETSTPRTVTSPVAPVVDSKDEQDNLPGPGSSGSTWRPGSN
ncbi:preprotein translocase subunit SecF [Corynebacterium renale]|uniref:protein translocase subunit SecF n=1 Tax=Corynebacterium renale TaxID=1724 RepID=UPI000DA341FA|nr:protein translocase subunit SecF [Corynebacterium renale]SQG64794.1 preprotein translocase subunit SecF [Corynebacterium renale]STC96277.1 preprotein translocase subunit SecF [Corynebacterium renale]